MLQYRIPFNKPTLVGSETDYLLQAVQYGKISGDGIFTLRCHALLEEILGAPRVLLTTSCTHALDMAAILLQVQPGDEVILPSFTFVSTVNSFVLRGAIPVFCDIRPDTLNIDERLIETKINQNTRAIAVVHYAGVGCDMSAIQEIAARYNLALVEDNAHGLFGKYRNQYLGTFGGLATQSFHETKNITCGEGGALVINDPGLIERAEIIREKGTNRSRFFRGQVDKYTWVDIGSSYLPSDILAAYLYAQLEQRETIQARRKQIWLRYHAELSDWARFNGVRQPVIPPECDQPYHLYYLLLPDLDRRQALIEYLGSRGILAVFHYLPLHLSEMGRKYGGKPDDCPVTEQVSDQLVRLPFYNSLTEEEQGEVISTVQSFKI